MSHGSHSGSANNAKVEWQSPPGKPVAADLGLLTCEVPPKTPAQLELEERALSQIAALVAIQASLLRHYFRLQEVERHISARVRPRGRAGSRVAIRLVELERQRLGRELHTGVGQLLAAIRLQLEVVDSNFPQPPPTAQQALHRISTLASDAMEQIRGVSKRLHPPEWQRLGLEQAIRQLWELSGVPEKYATRLVIALGDQEPELEQKVLIYRTAQEALSNIVRHAHSTRIDLTLERRETTLVLIIRDNGVGFDVTRLRSSPASVSSGIGLRAIREQAASLNARFVVESGPNGTTLEVSLPLHPVHP